MHKEQHRHIYTLIRNFLFGIFNREFLIFLFFLALSGTFWLLMALNETEEYEYDVPVALTGIPRKAVITSSAEDTLRVTLRDKGFTLAAYLLNRDRIKPIRLNFSTYAKDNGRGVIPQADLQKLIYKSLYSSTKIVSVKPEKWEFFYNYGQSKKVPIRLLGSVMPAKNYYLARAKFSPATATVYASKEMLDSIKYVTTEPVSISNFEDTVVQTVRLKNIRGMKAVPENVSLTLCPDILTEESVEIPITAVNMPEGKTLRTFPSRVKVRFVVGAAQFRQIKADQFRVEVNYKELSSNHADKCNLYLRKTPASVKNATLEVGQVDYLIEQ